MTIDIENPLIEEFFKEECRSDTKRFVDTIAEYIKEYRIKKSIKDGFRDIEMIKSGNIEKKELEDILDEL